MTIVDQISFMIIKHEQPGTGFWQIIPMIMDYNLASDVQLWKLPFGLTRVTHYCWPNPKFYKIIKHEQPGTGFWSITPITIRHQK